VRYNFPISVVSGENQWLDIYCCLFGFTFGFAIIQSLSEIFVHMVVWISLLSDILLSGNKPGTVKSI
jgi:hypothetical protein